MTEYALRDATRARLEAMRRAGEPIWYMKVHGSEYVRTGIPDWLICYGGLFLSTEQKLPKDRHKVSASQRLEMERIERAGGLVRVTRTLDEVEDLLAAARARWRI